MKPLPSDINAELSVLGAILLDNKIFEEVREIVNAEDFYSSKNKFLFESMEKLYIKKSCIDEITLSNEIGLDNLNNIGGISYVISLMDSTPSARNFKPYCNIVKDKSIRRKTIKALTEALYESYEGNISEVHRTLSKAFVMPHSEREIYSMSDIMELTLNQIEQSYKDGGKITGLSTGLKVYDKFSNGLKKGELSVISARPSMGKTAFTLNIADVISREHSCLMIQLEMTVQDIGCRLISSNAFIDGSLLQRGMLKEESFEKIINVADKLSQQKFNLYAGGNLSWNEIELLIKKQVLQNGIEVVFIDHLGLIKVPNKNRNVELGDITASAKSLALELNISIVFLSQLSRACEQRADHRPMLSDLRDSGSIEQDADLITFIYRDEYYNKDTEDKGIMECIIAKNRNGRVGTVKLSYIKEFQLITDIELLEQ